MSDYVLCSPNKDAFLAAADALGYMELGKLAQTGITQDGGNYFINVVGDVAENPGFWVRIRVNNGRPLPPVPDGFTLYPPPAFNSDGTPVDPAYVQPPYGQIA